MSHGDHDRVVPAPARRRGAIPAGWRGYVEALAIVTVASVMAWVMFPLFELSNLIMVYLLAVITISTRHGRGPSLLASVASVAAFDFFFVPPYLTFAVADTQYVVTFLVMLLAAMVISGLTIRIRTQAVAARTGEQQIAALYAMSRELAATRGVDELSTIAVRHIASVFQSDVALLLPHEARGLAACGVAPSQFGVDGSELAIARWVFEHRQPAGLGTATLPAATALYLPLLASRGPVGVLGVRPRERHDLAATEDLHRLETFANQTALAIERAQLANEAQQAQTHAETERLRNALLSSVSHDLRTPLATITGAATTILEGQAALDQKTQRDLLESVRDEAERLNRIVGNLLEMTRLESGAIELRRDWHPIEEVVGAALERLSRQLAHRRVTVNIPPDLPLAPIDDVLIEQLLVNLLDNAVKYTGSDTPIRIIASATDESVTVEIADRGPGLPRGEEDKVFEKFYRFTPGSGRGAGLGLAICRGIVQAHGGHIWAQNLPEGGVAFLFTLPLTGKPPAPVPADA